VGLPSSPVEFSSLRHSHKLSGSWLMGACPRSHQSFSGPPGLFIYSPGKDSLPPIFGTQCAPPSFPCIFIVLIAYYSVFLFSPGGGQSVQGVMLLWPRVVCGSTAVPLSSPCPCLPLPSGWGVTGGLGALLVSPFNMKWRCSVPAGGVEGSKFCLFSVVLPARCVSRVSPRFCYRRHAFCFLPLAAILESPPLHHYLKDTPAITSLVNFSSCPTEQREIS
jgi:hypothetical protein